MCASVCKCRLSEINSRKCIKSQRTLARTDKVRNAMSENELFVIQYTFQKYDIDDSGCLSFEELTAAINDLGYPATSADVREVLHIADADGSTAVDEDEFLTVVSYLLYPKHDESELLACMKVCTHARCWRVTILH